MTRNYIEINDAMRSRSADIATALVGDEGEPKEHRLDGDFCQYFTSMELAQWIRLLKMMDADPYTTKSKMRAVMDGILQSALDNLCATKKWAGQMDVTYEGHQEVDDFVRNKKHHDS